MAVVRSLPLTVKVWAEPAEPGVPSVVLPNASVDALTAIAGAVAEKTVPLTPTSCSVAPVLVAAIVPLSVPTEAVEVMRA